MAKINITTWNPDHCDCEIHYAWEDGSPEETRVHTPVDRFFDDEGRERRPQRCVAHAHLIDFVDHHEVVTKESQLRQNTLDFIKQHLPAEHKTIVEKEGVKILDFKNPPKDIFDQDRKFVVELHPTIGSTTRNHIKNKVAEKFADQVIII